MTHFYIGLLHNSKKKKNTFIGNRSRDFQYDVGKKYALNCANWVQKFKISLRKGALPPCNPRQGALPPGPPPGGQPPGTPVIAQQFGPPPFPATGSAPGRNNPWPEHNALLGSKVMQGSARVNQRSNHLAQQL